MTGTDPLTVLPEEPPGHVREVPRATLALRGVVLLTVVISILAAALVFVLYMSPVAVP